MQSADYVPGISGWKIDNSGKLVLNDGRVRVTAKNVMVTTAGPGMTNDQAAESIRESIAHEVQARRQADETLDTYIGVMECRLPEPFIVVDGVTYISQAEVDSGFVPKAKLSDSYSVKMELRDGQYFAAGIGLGVGKCFCKGGFTGDGPKSADRDIVDLIREAASKGASDGYRAALEDLKKST